MRDSPTEKKLTVYKFNKQSTKRGMQPQVVAPLVHQHQPAVGKPQPKRGATVKMKHGVWFLCEDRQSEFYHNGTTGQTFASPRTPAGTREAEVWYTRGPDPDLSQRLDVRRCLRPRGHGDTETVALIGDGHAFGKKHGTCHEGEPFSSRSALEPSARSLRNDPVTENVRGVRHSRCKSRRPNPSCSVLRGLRKCGREHRRSSRGRTSGGHQACSGSGGPVRGETREHAQTTIEVVRTSRDVSQV